MGDFYEIKPGAVPSFAEAGAGSPDPAGPSEDGAAWSYLEGGDAPPVEHYEPAAVPAAQ